MFHTQLLFGWMQGAVILVIGTNRDVIKTAVRKKDRAWGFGAHLYCSLGEVLRILCLVLASTCVCTRRRLFLANCHCGFEALLH